MNQSNQTRMRRNPLPVNDEDITWESHGLKCVARVSEIGIPCGYVAVPKDHPYYGKSYNDIHDIEVHGGLTYSEPAFWCRDDLWYLGFDCGHFYDIGAEAAKEYLGLYGRDKRIGALMEIADEIIQDKISGANKTTGPKDLDYVKAECEKLAEQLSRHSRDAQPLLS
jgi:hypothetical protein